MTKILRLIRSCRFGLHDISRTTLDDVNGLPRFDMPLELGMFLGAAHFGSAHQRHKRTLILDIERYRYQKFISDIAGQDIKSHQNDPAAVLGIVRDWINSVHIGAPLSGGKDLARQYRRFTAEMPSKLLKFKLHESEVSFVDWQKLVQD